MQMAKPMDIENSENIRESVRKAYSEIAKTGGPCCGVSSSCCGSYSAGDLAKGIGYSQEDLSVLPDGANMGLSCGNPTAIAGLKPGEIVLDIGSGGGFDVFIAAQKVGNKGLAIGVDMTCEMITKALNSIKGFTAKTGLSNVGFRLGEIEHLPVADETVDVVISNCVINLSPDKPQVWREIARVLKPGGRVCVSDLALLEPLPEKVKESAAALVGCISGAVLVNETEAMAKSAGLVNIELTTKSYNVDIMDECNDPLYKAISENLPEGKKVGDYVVSMDITALKRK